MYSYPFWMKKWLGLCHFAFGLDTHGRRDNGYYCKFFQSNEEGLTLQRVIDPCRAPLGLLLLDAESNSAQSCPLPISKGFLPFFLLKSIYVQMWVCVFVCECVHVCVPSFWSRGMWMNIITPSPLGLSRSSEITLHAVLASPGGLVTLQLLGPPAEFLIH